jgi:hypothetical protein
VVDDPLSASIPDFSGARQKAAKRQSGEGEHKGTRPGHTEGERGCGPSRGPSKPIAKGMLLADSCSLPAVRPFHGLAGVAKAAQRSVLPRKSTRNGGPDPIKAPFRL